MNKIGWDNVKIELIEKIVFTDKKDLIKKENEYIKKSILDKFCLNKYKSFDEKTSKIFIIKCPDDYFYIGSTVNATLSDILSDFKYESKYKKSKLYTHINSIGWDNINIELLEEFPSLTKKELILRQNEYIYNRYTNKCLNTQTPLNEEKTKQKKMARRKRSYEKNKEKIKEKAKAYYYENKDKIRKKQNEKREKKIDII